MFFPLKLSLIDPKEQIIQYVVLINNKLLPGPKFSFYTCPKVNFIVVT